MDFEDEEATSTENPPKQTRKVSYHYITDTHNTGANTATH